MNPIHSFTYIRYKDTDDYGMDRQTLVIREAFKKMRDNLPIMELVSFAGQAILKKSMDLINPSACHVRNIDGKKILYLSVPPEFYTPATTSQGDNVRIPSPEAAAHIQQVINGVIPPATE